jgi:hypothetical protein|tara:strand:- start:178 stop:408 length:231 start_codon:yes stop_codon:yes gene_type:complete
MKRIEKGTWYSRVEDILCRDFGNVYSKLTGITQQMLLQDTHAYVINRRDLDSLSEMDIIMLVEEHVASCIARSFRY